MRSVYGGRVRRAASHRLVFDDGDRFGVYICPGTPGMWMERDRDGRYLERWVRADPPVPFVWYGHNLQLVRRAGAHTVELFWDDDWRLDFWYLNLQAPVCETPLGFDTTDWALDVVVDPNGTPRWKDEDDFAEAIALGVFDEAGAAEVRAEGERAIAAHEWPTGWEDWRPPADWTPAELPRGWNVV